MNETMPENLNKEEQESYYNHLVNIWKITPLDVQLKFRKEYGCMLCQKHSDHLHEIQEQHNKERAQKAEQ